MLQIFPLIFKVPQIQKASKWKWWIEVCAYQSILEIGSIKVGQKPNSDVFLDNFFTVCAKVVEGAMKYDAIELTEGVFNGSFLEENYVGSRWWQDF